MSDLDNSAVRLAVAPRLEISCIALALALSAPALAQSDQPATGTTTAPAREGNIYDHKAHQPAEAEICAGKEATAACPSASEKQQVEREVQELLRQSGAEMGEKQRELNTPR